MAAEIEQRLAAILVADVAGYTRLMAADEPATIATITDYRSRFRDHIAANGGRVVDMAGDSVLAIFASVAGAVRAAVATQAELTSCNEALAEARRMHFRIGVNLGDIHEHPDGSVYGDGVNIAARLESLAAHGGIMLSEDAWRQVRRNADLTFADAGLHEVKNVADPVRAYRVETDPTEATLAPPPEPIFDRPSIVVLPFENMSGDAEQSYFSDGISEDVITELSKVPGLFVIARNSAFVYKGKAHHLPDVASALGVRYVLEGSVRKAGNRVRITAQLIDGTSGGHLWAERYDRDLEDIFAVQDEVTAAIVEQLSLKLGPTEKTRTARRGTPDMAAWDLFMRGRESAWRHTRSSTLAATRILRQVVALDDNFAAAHAMLGFARVSEHINGWGDDAETGLGDGLAEAETAIRLDPNEALGHFVHALGLSFAGRLEDAIVAAERAVAVDPNLNHAHTAIGASIMYLGRTEEALGYFQTAMRLDPFYPTVFLHLTALAHYMLGDDIQCRAMLEKRLSLEAETDSTPFLLAACLGRLGEPEAARRRWREVFQVNPDFSVAQRRRISPYRDKRHFDDILDGLRLAGIDPDTTP